MTFPLREAALPFPAGRILTPASPEFSTAALLRTAPGGGASAAWAGANDPIAVPFALPYGAVVQQLGWGNGSSAGGGVALAIYDTGWNRKATTGAQTGAGSSTWQWIDITDVALPAGRYYLVMVRDNITANRAAVANLSAATAALLGLFGVQGTTTASYPPPDPMAGMASAATFTRIPIMAIACRAVF